MILAAVMTDYILFFFTKKEKRHDGADAIDRYPGECCTPFRHTTLDNKHSRQQEKSAYIHVQS